MGSGIAYDAERLFATLVASLTRLGSSFHIFPALRCGADECSRLATLGAHTRDSARSVNNLPAHNRRHYFSWKLPAIKRSVVRQRPRLGGLKRPALLGIEDSYVGEVAAHQRSAAAEIEYARWPSGKEFDDPRQRNILLAVKLGDGQRQRGFQSRDAKRGGLELDLLFVGRMRGVVGGNGVHGAVGQGDQNSLAVRGRAQRRVHLEIRVVLAHVLVEQSEVVRRHFAGHPAGDASIMNAALAATHCLERLRGG